MTKLYKMTTAGLAAAGILAVGLMLNSQEGRADDNPGNSNDPRVEQGLKIAPVQLNMKGKSRNLVGLGSYLVNGVGGCNDCHTWRKDPMAPNGGSNYAVGGDPFAGQPEQIYVAGYLAGGRDFGPFRSRNLTPDSTGKVADGWSTFKQIMQHGLDPDQMTPVLQVMPWPIYRNMKDDDLRAIYEYLTAIPCREGNPGESFQNPDGTTAHRCN